MNKWLVGSVATLGAIVMVWAFWPSSEPVADATVASQSVQAAIADTTVEAGALPAARPQIDVQSRTPVAHHSSQMEQLLQRANSGDVSAACQLGIALGRCSRLEQLRDELRNSGKWLTDGPELSPEQQAKRQAAAQQSQDRIRNELSTLEQNCGGFAKNSALDEPHWHLRAALAGNKYSKYAFRSDTSYLARAAIERPELVKLYADYAPKFWHDAVNAGDPRVLGILAEALAGPNFPGRMRDTGSGSSNSWLRWVHKPNPVLARTYAQAFAREQQREFPNAPLPENRIERERELEMREMRAATSKLELEQFDIGLTPQQIKTSNTEMEQLLKRRAPAVTARLARKNAALNALRSSAEPVGQDDEKLCRPAD